MKIPVAIVGHVTSGPMLGAFVRAGEVAARAQLATGAYEPLYESGIVYRNETRSAPNPGVERFQLPSSLYALGYGDCDDLAMTRAAEINLHNARRCRSCRQLVLRAEPYAYSPRDGLWHIVVRDLRTGRIEDPSARLGMLER